MSQITISWDADAAPVDGYNVYRGTTASNEGAVPLNATPLTATTYMDSTVFPGHTYFYKVKAVLNGVESLGSLEVASTPVPFPPVPAMVQLGAASSHVALAGSTITNVPGTNTLANGDVGVSPGTSITGFVAPASISGVFHAGDFVSAGAQSALTKAFNDAAARTGGVTMTGDIGGQTLGPGVYTSASSLGITGATVLDGKGNPDATWIFQIGSTLTTAAGSSVVLMGGAQASNVFWQIGSSATLGAGSAFAGNLMAQASITLGTGVNVNGRALARVGAITMDNASIVATGDCGAAIPPSPPNVAPPPPLAPLNPRITAEA